MSARLATTLDGVKQDVRCNDNHLGRFVRDDCRRLVLHVVAPVKGCCECLSSACGALLRHSGQNDRDAPLSGDQEAVHAHGLSFLVIQYLRFDAAAWPFAFRCRAESVGRWSPSCGGSFLR